MTTTPSLFKEESMTRQEAAAKAAELKALLIKIQNELTTCDDERAEQLMVIHDGVMAKYHYMDAFASL